MVIHPKHKANFLPLFQDIDRIFEEQGKVIYQQRNTIKVLEWQGQLINIKKFAVPHPINQFAYRWIRPPKAKRAYEHSIILLDNNIPTPEAIGYIVRKDPLLIKESYLVTFQSPLSRTFYEFDKGGVEGREEIIAGLGRLAANMHEKNLLHLDFSPGNILFDLNESGTPEYTIVDINRMKFGAVSLEAGCANLQRLWGGLDFLQILSEAYAEARNADPAKVFHLIQKNHAKFWSNHNSWY